MTEEPGRLTHLDETGSARMVEVGDKDESRREAVAECRVAMTAATQEAIRQAAVKKGDVLGVARVAGIMAAKRTADLIPLCHPLAITGVEIDFAFADGGLTIRATARVRGRTGVEMEALTAAAVAGLAVIDMVKGMERGVHLEAVRLLEKSGGRSGHWRRPPG